MSDDKVDPDLKGSTTTLCADSPKPQDEFMSVRDLYPKVKFRDVALAAFSIVIEAADKNPALALSLQEFT